METMRLDLVSMIGAKNPDFEAGLAWGKFMNILEKIQEDNASIRRQLEVSNRRLDALEQQITRAREQSAYQERQNAYQERQNAYADRPYHQQREYRRSQEPVQPTQVKQAVQQGPQGATIS